MFTVSTSVHSFIVSMTQWQARVSLALIRLEKGEFGQRRRTRPCPSNLDADGNGNRRTEETREG